MIARNPIQVKIGASSWDIKPGQIVPAPVLRYWEKTPNTLARLLAQGTIEDETAPAPKKAVKKTAEPSAKETEE